MGKVKKFTKGKYYYQIFSGENEVKLIALGNYFIIIH